MDKESGVLPILILWVLFLVIVHLNAEELDWYRFSGALIMLAVLLFALRED